MCSDAKWKQKLAGATESNNWGVLDVYSDDGADGSDTPEASAEYGWIVRGTDAQSLETWARRLREQQGWEACLKRWTPPGRS